MNSVIDFFEPFFSTFLFNHKNLALIEISFLCTVFSFVVIDQLVQLKPNTSLVGYALGISIILFLSTLYLTFVELTWWKSIINIVVSLFLFVFISKIILLLILVIFGSFYNFSDEELKPKRYTVFLMLIIISVNVIVSLYIKDTIF